MKRSGFTLIELLVVISIISILASILFPAFSKAREKARQIACVSNVKQISMSIMMYAEDNEETLPWSNAIIDESVTTWQEAIQPYAKNKNIFMCPTSAFPTRYPDGTPQTWNGHFGCNGMIMGSASSRGGSNLSALSRPSDTYLLMDAGGVVIYPDDVITPYYSSSTYPNSGLFSYLPGSAAFSTTGIVDYSSGDATWTSYNSVARNDYKNGRHSGGVVVGFADGHAKWTTVAEIVRQTKQYDADTLAGVSSASAWSQ